MGASRKKFYEKYGETRRRSLRRLAAVVFLIIMTCTACGSGGRVVFTVGLGRNEVFRIGREACTVPEFMVYLVNTQSQYERVYGPEVWKVMLDGVTLEENVKDTVLAKAAQIKAMYLLAQSKDIVLSEPEERQAEQAAEEFFQSLGEEEATLMGIKLTTVEELYREYALADKVYQYIIKDVNPEISDDEARTITVQHILFRTYTTDGAGNRIDYSDKVRRTVCEKACEIREAAAAGEQDFVELASHYSEDSTITYSFGKGELDAVFEEAAFSLETGEVSQVVETDAGYHIIKCISTFDREQTDRNKQVIVEQRRRDVFGQEYDAFVETLARQLNTKLWEEIALPHTGEAKPVDFFDIYQKYFPDSYF